MTAPAPSTHKPAGHHTDPAAWLKAHKKPAAAAAAGVGVVAFALYQRNKSGTAAASSPAIPGGLRAAGLAYPVHGYGGPEHDRQIRHGLDHRHPPKGPKIPPRLPKPGHKRYTIKPGDTLTSIATAVYGEAPARAIRRLKVANPLLWSFGARSPLSYYAGDTIRVPALHPGGHQPHRHGGHKPPRRPHHEPPPPRNGHGRFPHEPAPRRRTHREHAPHPSAGTHLHVSPRPATKQRRRRRRRGA